MIDRRAGGAVRMREDRVQGRRWLVGERHRQIALWIYAAQSGENGTKAERHYALALALDSTLKALDALYPQDGGRKRAKPEPPANANRARSWKRVPRPREGASSNDWTPW